MRVEIYKSYDTNAAYKKNQQKHIKIGVCGNFNEVQVISACGCNKNKPKPVSQNITTLNGTSNITIKKGTSKSVKKP